MLFVHVRVSDIRLESKAWRLAHSSLLFSTDLSSYAFKSRHAFKSDSIFAILSLRELHNEQLVINVNSIHIKFIIIITATNWVDSFHAKTTADHLIVPRLSLVITPRYAMIISRFISSFKGCRLIYCIFWQISQIITTT